MELDNCSIFIFNIPIPMSMSAYIHNRAEAIFVTQTFPSSHSMNMYCNPSLLNAILPPFSYADQMLDATAAVILASLFTLVPAYASNEPSLLRSMVLITPSPFAWDSREERTFARSMVRLTCGVLLLHLGYGVLFLYFLISV